MTDINKSSNPDICTCSHHKHEHGGRLTKYAKKFSVGQKFINEMTQKRITDDDFPKLKKYFACTYPECVCEKYTEISK